MPAGNIRDFRGSLTTDIEKGVFITTGTFTKAAREEASNAGKQQIDLIDGEEFINKLIECRLGVHEKIIYEVDKPFLKKCNSLRFQLPFVQLCQQFRTEAASRARAGFFRDGKTTLLILRCEGLV